VNQLQLEEAARPLVRAALRHDVEHAAVAAAVFGLEPLGDEVELLDRFEREELQEAADRVVVVVAAVDLVVHVAAGAAVDLGRVLRALGRIRMEPEADAGHRCREVRELASVEREAFDAAGIDHLADRRRGGGDERRLAGDGDRFGEGRDLQLDVHVGGLRHVDHQTFLLDAREPLQFRDEVVYADG
jgi:hypothetical protein